MQYCVTTPPPGAIVGTMKIAENSSALPHDRIYFDYSYFGNTALTAGGIDVNRFTPGFEKTFFGGMASLDLRIPMANTLNSTITSNRGTDLSNAEFGNIALTPKVLLLNRSDGALAAGMTFTLPTADDVHVVARNGTRLVHIRNDTLHLMPFFGWLWTPNPRWYAQGFLQYDFATGGNRVRVNNGAGLNHAGYLNDTTFQYFDVAIGRYLRRSSQPGRFRSLSVTGELHWNKSLQAGDNVAAGNFRVGSTATNVDVWDATVGVNMRLNDVTITAAYVAPLGGGQDRPFDGEFRLMVNRWFGPYSGYR